MIKLVSFKYAFRGIYRFFNKETQAILHLIVSIVVIFMGFLFQISLTEWIVVLICIVGVFSLEAMNTAIEILCDIVSPDSDKRIRDVKDIAAGAVLIFSLGTGVVGVVIFIPYILNIM